LIYDGFLIRKKNDEDFEYNLEDALHQAEDAIYDEYKIKIKLTTKSMETDWKPIIIEEDIGEDYIPSVNKKYFDACYTTDEDGHKSFNVKAIRRLTEYINKHVCKIVKPPVYGWRFNTKDEYQFLSLEQVEKEIQYGFKTKDKIVGWLSNDNRLTYKKWVFEPDETKVPKNVLNLYIRPKYKYDPNFDFHNSVYGQFLKTIICNNDEKAYVYQLNYISNMYKFGKTYQPLVLIGKKELEKEHTVSVYQQ